MKYLTTSKDDNTAIFIFILLSIVLFFSFLERVRWKGTLGKIPGIYNMAGTVSMLCVILVTLLVPPVGILLISGCNVDLCINILLTILGYVPGLIHALYLEHVYYSRRNVDPYPASEGDVPGVYSNRIQHGGHHYQIERTYGTV